MSEEYIQSQYGNSYTIKKLLSDFGNNINPDTDIDVFYENMFDIDSAIGIGLDIIGKIVGVNRTVTLNNNGITLNDDTYRNYIKFKMYANISEATLETVNKISTLLYNNTNLTANNVITEGTLDNGDKYNTTPMQIRFTWTTNNATDEERAVFMNGVLCLLAAGVGWDIQIIQENDFIFGFAGSGLNPFNQGVFIHSDVREESSSDGNN